MFKYKIIEIVTVRLYVDGFNSKFKKTTNVDKQEFGYDIDLTINFHEDSDRVDIVGDIKVKIDKKDPVVVVHQIAIVAFEVFGISKHIDDGNEMPTELREILQQIAIGAFRGLLTAHVAGTPISLYTLPIIDIKNFELVDDTISSQKKANDIHIKGN